MAFFDSRVSTFALGSTGSTNISAYIKGIDGLPGVRDLNDVTTFGALGHRWAAGLENTVITIDLIYSEDATVGTDTIFGPLRTTSTAQTFWFFPSATTGKSYSGSFFVEDYSIQSRIGDAILAKVTAKVDNGVTRT